MRLVIAVVQGKDAENLMAALRSAGYRATQINSAGGFLREQNVTVLIGVDDTQVPDVLRIIKANCYTRTQYVNPLLPIVESGEFYVPNPIEVEVGGANVFVVPVERYERLP
ncbi:cyclic-di-AMP receptor [Thermomicrobiaceae bacterium CFH 74404]|uniref:Cyclic-di-AMP receptor n=3 Tax=Thermomicrobia TaxID=189775 RepID=A0AA42B9E7_9BACT|nr:cyclic-di-AMP receptor [Thermalbibacter longus]MCM8748456.1 cyclic-di-AMP receptor [Thermalbibacter longus]